MQVSTDQRAFPQARAAQQDSTLNRTGSTYCAGEENREPHLTAREPPGQASIKQKITSAIRKGRISWTTRTSASM